jgi:IS605 OrfB family transposase
VRCIAKVADAYKLDRKTKREFRPHGAIAYDERILRFKPGDKVSIRLIEEREVIPFLIGETGRALFVFRKGEVDLFFRQGAFFLSIICDVPEPEQIDALEALGVDLGIVNLATDSDGNIYSGAAVEKKRRIYSHRRRNLQRKKTRSAHRKLRSLKGRQARYQRDVNHCISKQIVVNAQRTGRAIGLEDLQGIRERVTARKRQRARLHNWGFGQLRSFITYKARLAGVRVVLVDPRNTSRTCPACGHCEKANRPSQSVFSCVNCRFSAPADVVAAGNISARAAVNRPLVTA